ncbi:MAG: hypothetical protein JO267_07790 [Alphaproteobacteria bacterium]|nr:hypothetical protein [Alphaproteobacteria bacterium]
MAAGSETSGQPPRQSDPKVAALLNIVFDTSALNLNTPLPFSDLNNVNDWLLQVLNAGSVYILAGTGYTDFSKIVSLGGPAQEALQQKVAANTVAFAPEMGRYVDSQLNVMQALIMIVTADMAADPQKLTGAMQQKGVADMRQGLVTTLVGAITMLPTDGLSDDWRRERLPALAAVAPKAAAFLLPDQRKTVHDISLQVAQTMSDAAVKDGLTAFAQAVGG